MANVSELEALVDHYRLLLEEAEAAWQRRKPDSRRSAISRAVR